MEPNDEYEGTELERRPIVIRGDTNGNGTKVVWALVAIIVAIVGFLGSQVWAMNERLARVETNVATLLSQP